MTTKRPVNSPPWLMGDPIRACGRTQVESLRAYAEMLARFNRRINLISRESVGDLWTLHIVHSLYLASRRFAPGSVVVDWGTGGGVPLIPLAIAFPEVRFVGVDSAQKKVFAVRSVLRRLDLANVEVWAGRAEAWGGKADYSVSRATAPLLDLWQWHRRVARQRVDLQGHADAWDPGLVCLKGGDLSAEVNALKAAFPDARVEDYALDSSVYDGQFADKTVVTVTQGDDYDLDS